MLLSVWKQIFKTWNGVAEEEEEEWGNGESRDQICGGDVEEEAVEEEGMD